MANSMLFDYIFNGSILGIGVVMFTRILRMRIKGEKTTGTVTRVDNVIKGSSDDDPIYPVIISYTTKTGDQMAERYKMKTNLSKVGDKFVLYYDPARPSKFVIYDFAAFIFPVAFLLGGLIFLYINIKGSH